MVTLSIILVYAFRAISYGSNVLLIMYVGHYYVVMEVTEVSMCYERQGRCGK